MVFLPLILFFIDRFFYYFFGGRLLFLISASLIIAIYLLFNKLRFNFDFRIIALLFFTAFSINIIFAQNFSFHSGYISIFVRIFYGATFFSYLLLNQKSTKSYFFLAGSLIFLVIFESGIFIQDLNPSININEISIYLLILLTLFPFFKSIESKKEKGLLLLVGLLIFLSGSRQNILVLVLGFLFMSSYYIFRFNIMKIITSLFYILLLFLPILILLIDFFDLGEFLYRKFNFFNIFSNQFLQTLYSGDSARLEAFDFVRNSTTIDSLIFGHGLGSSVLNWRDDFKILHNGYLTVFYELGLFGTLALIYMVITSLKPLFLLFRLRNSVPFEYVISASFIAAIPIQGMFIEILSKPTLFIVFGMSLALLEIIKREIQIN